MEIPKTIIDLEALLIALAQQTEPLPEYLQRSLKEIERLLREEQPQAATQLRQLVKDFPPLEKAYKKAIEELDAAYANQERTKSLSVTFPDSLDFESLFINDVIPSQDWVKTAQKLAGSPLPPLIRGVPTGGGIPLDPGSPLPPLIRGVPTGGGIPLDPGSPLPPLIRGVPTGGGIPLDREGADSPRFWDKADRLMVVTVGGAALGGSIAGVYGAVIGAILAAGCGWYITFRKAKSA
ncbi:MULTISPECIES: hypothetical protein [unclassified Microcystis]|uniref:hypothetical protein n=2 Tax=Microcystis TaxID=1125 RepID=UPI00258FFD37|nr:MULTISPECIES: hypothetical protein [unclassified Microcystis]MCA2816334.1 hypothetical protein [Microcystis sp. M085S1]MCA2630457.1 hypothetical protein [Microcystis sp. M091S2]MCA2770235.1 hypothetical protein [Microcystis sp. M122S2]MCA2786210.1 hypothetical protein [Microcystis sp. M116S2]MCA2798108.1 hypothetical protein [Microcystis sp. M100S2]